MSVQGSGTSADRFGEVIAAGDLNGDGMDDLVISASQAASNAGEVHIVFGTAGGGEVPQSTADWTLRGATGQRIGASLVVHDVDSDGSQDLLVGVPQAGSSDEGEVWVFLGPLSDSTPSIIRGSADADYLIRGDIGDEVGSAVAADNFDPNTANVPVIAVGGHEADTRDGVGYVLLGQNLASDAVSGVIDLGNSSKYERRYTGSSNEYLGYAVAVTANGVAFGAPWFDRVSGSARGRMHWMQWDSGTGLPASGAAATAASQTVTGDLGYRKVGIYLNNVGPITTMSPSNSDVIVVMSEEGDGLNGDLMFFGTTPSGGVGDYDATELASLGTGFSPDPHVPKRAAIPIGDWDGDEFADFVYSDSGWDTDDALKQGAVVFKLGGGGLYSPGDIVTDTGPRDMVNVTTTDDERFGWALAAGDFNGDGITDVAASWPGDPDVSSGAGSVRVYYGPMYGASGGAGVLADVDAILLGDVDSDFAGLRTEGIGDVNCDGVDDVAVAAQFAQTSAPPSVRAGEAYLYFGRTQDEGELLWKNDVEDAHFRSSSRVFGISDGDKVGRTFGVGDLDGDGCDDFVLSGHGVDNGSANNAGASYLFYGRSTFAPAFDVSTADATFTSAIGASLFGWHVDSTDDLDGDGFKELVFGAPSDGTGGTDAGSTYLFHTSSTRFAGSYTVRADADCMIDGSAGDEFGYDVIGFDIDNSGSRDLVVGAPHEGNGTVRAWTTWPCSGGADAVASSTSSLEVQGQFVGSGFGFSLAALGPFESESGDVPGLAVGAPLAGASSGNPSPRVSVIPAGLTGSTYVTPAGGFDVCGSQVAGRFGYAIGSGNMTWDDDRSDGRAWDEDLGLELFVGEPLHSIALIDPGDPNDVVWVPRGRAYGFEGHEMRSLLGTPGCALDVTVPTDVWWVVEGMQDLAGLGYAIGGAGDLNRDGLDDVIVGQPAYDHGSGTDQGRVGIGLSSQSMP